MNSDDATYGISSARGGLSGRVILYFSNGTKQEFLDCKDIEEITDAEGVKKIVFTQGKHRFVFKKDSLAGWSLPMTV